MKITKYRHACIVLEEQGKKLVIDPGGLTPDFGDANNIVAVVVSHVHDDHLSTENLQKIVDANPNAKIFTTPEAAQEWGDPHAQAVKAGDEATAGPFSLIFCGELHRAVHPEWPQCQNIGVMVNGCFYYAGDSLTIPDRKVEVLAAPAAYAWLKIGEVMDYVKTINPQTFFRTHDAPLSQEGITTADGWFQKTSEKFGPKYHPLNPGDSLEI